MEKIITFLILGIILFFGSLFLKNIKNKLKPEEPAIKNLHFKNNLAAFKYAVKYLYDESFITNTMSFGIVQEKSISVDGSYHFLIQLSNSNRTVLVSGFNDKFADEIDKGNLVYWGYIESVQESENMGIEAMGHVLATLNPELNLKTSKWVVRKDLTK